jgi:DNA-binding NarL/FixJ family response regulator
MSCERATAGVVQHAAAAGRRVRTVHSSPPRNGGDTVVSHGGHMIRVGILDICPVFMHGLADLLSGEDMTVIATTTSPSESALRLADVLIVDPEAVTRLDVAGYIAERAAEQTVLVLTASAPENSVNKLIQAGVAGVIGKREPVDAMVCAVRTAISGQLRADDRSGPKTLSWREREVLLEISRGLTHGQIGRRLGISRHTVDTYVKRVRAKVGVGNKAELTRIAVLGSDRASNRTHRE